MKDEEFKKHGFYKRSNNGYEKKVGEKYVSVFNIKTPQQLEQIHLKLTGKKLADEPHA